jgi:hypothetical protein
MRAPQDGIRIRPDTRMLDARPGKIDACHRRDVGSAWHRKCQTACTAADIEDAFAIHCGIEPDQQCARRRLQRPIACS